MCCVHGLHQLVALSTMLHTFGTPGKHCMRVVKHRELNRVVMPCRLKKDIVTGAANAVFVFNQVLIHLQVCIMISAFLTLTHLESAVRRMLPYTRSGKCLTPV